MLFKNIDQLQDGAHQIAELFTALGDIANLSELKRFGGCAPYTMQIIFAEDNQYNHEYAITLRDKQGYSFMLYLHEDEDGTKEPRYIFPCFTCNAQLDGTELGIDCEECEHNRAIDEEKTKWDAYYAWRRS